MTFSNPKVWQCRILEYFSNWPLHRLSGVCAAWPELKRTFGSMTQ